MFEADGNTAKILKWLLNLIKPLGRLNQLLGSGLYDFDVINTFFVIIFILLCFLLWYCDHKNLKLNCHLLHYFLYNGPISRR